MSTGEIKFKAEESEVIVREICRDIKSCVQRQPDLVAFWIPLLERLPPPRRV